MTSENKRGREKKEGVYGRNEGKMRKKNKRR